MTTVMSEDTVTPLKLMGTPPGRAACGPGCSMEVVDVKGLEPLTSRV